MSTPRITIERVALVIVPIATAVVFIAVLAVEEIAVEYDLQLMSPPAVAPGEPVPMRAFFFALERDPAPPELEARSVRITIADADGQTMAEGELAPARAADDGPAAMGEGRSYDPRYGMEGFVVAPVAIGDYTIRAEVLDEGEPIARCDAPLVVTETPRGAAAAGRPMMPMQQWQHMGVETVAGQTAPAGLELRVRGGYCKPDRPCELLVWVGAPAAALRLEGRGIEIEDPSAVEETEGIVRFRGTVRGPEAMVTLVASRGDGGDGGDGGVDVEVARRDVRLPIVQSGVSFGSVDTTGNTAGFLLPGEPLVIDAFRDGVWVRATSVARREVDGGTLPLDLEEGLYRLQIRSDPFGVDSAATYFVYTGDDDEAVRALRERLLAEESTDTFTTQMPLPEIPMADQAAFAAALLEADIVPLPRARSGLMQADLGIVEERMKLRWIAGFAVFALGLLVAAWVMRRGLVASLEARELMSAAGDEAATSRRNVVSMTLSVAAVVLATVLAFLAAALLLVTRGV